MSEILGISVASQDDHGPHPSLSGCRDYRSHHLPIIVSLFLYRAQSTREPSLRRSAICCGCLLQLGFSIEASHAHCQRICLKHHRLQGECVCAVRSNRPRIPFVSVNELCRLCLHWSSNSVGRLGRWAGGGPCLNAFLASFSDQAWCSIQKIAFHSYALQLFNRRQSSSMAESKLRFQPNGSWVWTKCCTACDMRRLPAAND